MKATATKKGNICLTMTDDQSILLMNFISHIDSTGTTAESIDTYYEDIKLLTEIWDALDVVV